MTAPTIVGGRTALAGAAVVVSAALSAWALARPLDPPTGAVVRALADGAAVVTLGLTVVPMLEVGRHRAELVEASRPALAVGAAVWVIAEVVRLVVVTAQAVARPVTDVTVSDFVAFAAHTTAGRVGLISVGAAGLVCALAVAAPRVPATAVAAAGVAAVGLAARTLVGHLADSPWGGVAVTVHALAAAVWCGVLAALVLTVGHRGRWARVLPRFSQLSLVCVAVLLAAGVVGASAAVDSVRALYATGYGRVLTAKVAVTAALLVLAWRHRAGWLPAARAHRATAGLSRTRSLIELAIMAVTVSLAAALAVTG